MIKWALFLLPLLMAPDLKGLKGSEIDSFGAVSLQRPLGDSSTALDRQVQKLLQEALLVSNRISGCGRERLLSEVSARLSAAGIFGVGHLEEEVQNNPNIDKLQIPLEQSVYRDMRFTDSPALHLYGLGVVLRLGPYHIGNDKLGHFLADGFHYFKKSRMPHQSLESILQYGESTESGLFGLSMTGVYSYADLVANFQGMHFWWNVFGALPEHLKSSITVHPYFECAQQKWVQVRPFHWADYTDSAWDETFNCNDYSSIKMQLTIDQRMSEILRPPLKMLGSGYHCPLGPHEEVADQCKKLALKYGPAARSLLNPHCFGQKQ